MDLLDLLRVYPGGIPGLSHDSGLSTAMLYRVASREHRLPPVQQIDAIAKAFSGKLVLGKTHDAFALLDLWKRPAKKQRKS